MDANEIKDRLKNVINAVIRGDSDAATSELHDVLVAKTRNTVSPEISAAPAPAVDETDPDLDSEVDTDPPVTTEND